MITVSLCGTEIVVRPKCLLDYVEKLDYIKSRRTSPYDLLRNWEVDTKKADKGAGETKMLIEAAMVTVYTRSSSVSYEEEIHFNGSPEGYFYNVWRCTRVDKNEKPAVGVSRIEKLWNSATAEEIKSLNLAIESTDESHNLKNSAGPSEHQSSTPGPQ